MERASKFHRLKQLHETLHSERGLLNIAAITNGCSSNSKFVKRTLRPNEELGVQSQEEKARDLASDFTEENESSSQAATGLFNAVKDLYEDNGVKLIPHKIFVGNISYKLTTSQLKTFFLSFGKVIHAQIVKDRVKKKSKGYGFITFGKDSEVQKVLQASEDQLILDGRRLRVNRAEKKKRGRPILKLSDETDPQISLEDFVREYHEATEDVKCSQSENETMQSEGSESLKDAVRIDENVVTISTLNDDTLLHIFSLLNVKDRVKIERVCHRWLNLARQTWLFTTHLNFKGIFRSFRGTGGLTDGILLSLFRRGCQNLKSLDLSHSSRLLTDYSLYLIGKNCPDLQELNLSGVNVTMKSLKDLSSNCSKLKKIQLQRCYDVGEKGLWWLLKQCEELEYVDVGGNIRITGQCFFMLTDRCKTIILDDCIKLTDSGLQQLVKRSKNLQELNISNCLYLTDVGISELFTGCTKLRKLSFCKSPKDVSAQSLMALRNLNLLEELHLAKQDAVNNDVLFVIGNSCPYLRILNLEACHNVTDRGIQYLTSCNQLHKLVISYLDEVRDLSIELMAQNGFIKEFHARSCLNLTDKAIEQLALHCPQLRELDLSGSEGIKNTSLDLLEKYLGDNEEMSLVIGGTAISRERALLTQERYPNWNVTTQNLSDHHLRVDFDPYMDMGRILPEYDDEDGTEEFGLSSSEHDAEYYLTADDPSTWEYDGQWLS